MRIYLFLYTRFFVKSVIHYLLKIDQKWHLIVNILLPARIDSDMSSFH